MPLSLSHDTDRSQPSTAQIMSATKVFAVPELFQAIFLLLPARDILTLRRTSRNFRSYTQGSRKLQRRKFLQPGVAEDLAEISEEEQPELTTTTPLWGGTLNPLLFGARQGMFVELNPPYQFQGFAIQTICRIRWLEKGGSYMGMQLTSPPTTKLQLRREWWWDDSWEICIANEAGVTLSDVVNGVPSAWKDIEGCIVLFFVWSGKEPYGPW